MMMNKRNSLFQWSFLVIALLSSSFLWGARIEVSGHISSSTIWSPSDTIVVTDTLWVDFGVDLSLEAGVVVLVQTAAQGAGVIPWVIEGSLTVNGTESDTVFIIPASPEDYWGGIFFSAQVKSVQSLSYLHLDVGIGNPEYPPLIQSDYTSLDISHSSFKGQGSFAMALNGTQSKVNYCSFRLDQHGILHSRNNDFTEIENSQSTVSESAWPVSMVFVNDSSSLKLLNNQFLNPHDGSSGYFISFNGRPGNQLFVDYNYFEKWGNVYVPYANQGELFIRNNRYYDVHSIIQNESGLAYVTGNSVHIPAGATGSGIGLASAIYMSSAVITPIVHFNNNSCVKNSEATLPVFYIYDASGGVKSVPTIIANNNIIWGWDTFDLVNI
ncbi:MAG TPA: hypothetical protein ENN84_05625, partial [Candidatus Marinimicrobia bacterium]|nr:hypothetical protein [Candidatus Neomarinimicrobiota bacterium]